MERALVVAPQGEVGERGGEGGEEGGEGGEVGRGGEGKEVGAFESVEEGTRTEEYEEEVRLERNVGSGEGSEDEEGLGPAWSPPRVELKVVMAPAVRRGAA